MNRMVKKEAKPRGRPRQFDESDALDAALRVFWAKGYDGATIDDLTEAMEIGRPSLYATFGDKEALFARCLERYGETFGGKTLEALRSAKDVHGAFRAFLRQAVVNATGEDTPAGCVMACVVPAVDDVKVRQAVASSFRVAASLLEERLRAGVREQQLGADFPVATRARAVVDASNALALRARLGARRAELLADADRWVAVLLGDEATGKSPRKGKS
jgi:AcrR family transcriptional regulator